MLLETFLQHNNLYLNHHELKLCDVAIKMMTASVDPNHDQEHVFAILSDLNYFLEQTDELVKAHINLKALVIAICWHDTWKSTRPNTLNLFKFIYEQYWDGRGSYHKFLTYIASQPADELPPPEELELIAYIIKHHARFDFFFPRWFRRYVLAPRLAEARIMRDIDSLEGWNIKRLQHLEKIFMKNDKPRGVLKNRAILLPLRVYYRVMYQRPASGDCYYYHWPRTVFLKRKDEFLAEFKRIWKVLHGYYHMPYRLIEEE